MGPRRCGSRATSSTQAELGVGVTVPVRKDLVLVGAGHAHVEVLRRFGLRPVDGVRLTLVTRERHTPYSGMLPGLVAGRYAMGEAHVDTVALARFAGARLCHDEAVGLDLAGRRVLCRSAPPVPYDLLSLDVGSRPNTGDVRGAAEHAMPVKPIDGFVARFEALRTRVASGQSKRVVMVGGGAGGVELLLSVERRLRRDATGLQFSIVTASPDILPAFPPAFRTRFAAILRARGITVHAGHRVTRVASDHVEAGGEHIPADEVLWTTEAAPASWLADTGLALDPAGFARVDAMLRASGRNDVFAAGDMVAFDPSPIPRSGVYAVRAGPALAGNLRATLLGTPLRAYRPQRHALTIVSTGEPYAVLTRNGLVAGGRWAWWLKDRIDRRFVDRYNRLPERRG